LRVVLDGFRPLAMRSSNDCGPTAMLQALRHLGSVISYEELLRVWRFREGADRTDTPGHHLLALKRLGVPVSMRRRLGRRRLERALSEGRPVVMLVPTGIVRWHWVVACGLEDGAPVISPGDGRVVKTGWADLAMRARARPEGRPLRVDGLGYCVGTPRAFEPDVALERDLVRLARVAEGALAPVEPIARAARRLAAKIAWNSAGPGGNLGPETSRETGR
jgi:hypothetical protein